MLSKASDIVIVGAGIVGLSLARALKKKYTDCRITILEKESQLGCHSSGRNSGVLHSGIYYPQGSIKAKVCVEGAKALSEYCLSNQLPIKPVGKVIIPVHPSDDQQLEVLYNRAIQNGVPVEWLDEQQLKALEPETTTITGKALYSPSTAVFDPLAIVKHMAEELKHQGVNIRLGCQVQDINPQQQKLMTNEGTVPYGHLFNTAGLHADRIAKPFGVGLQYKVLPFKGIYYKLDPNAQIKIHHHIYPVPDLSMPFLGVHFTQSVSKGVYIGPTAVPAFGRENYQLFQGLDVADTPGILTRLLQLYATDTQGFRKFAHQEGTRYFKKYFIQAAKTLVPKIKSSHLLSSDKVGIRPQLLDTKTGTLVMDFLIENQQNSTHILNAISPAFTCALSFSEFVLNQYFDINHTEASSKQYAAQR